MLVEKADDVLSDAGREKLHARLDEAIGKLTADIERSPKTFDLYSRRGDQRFFRGQFAEAIQDYEKMVELRPETEASHWRRGIAYFYAERYKDAIRQWDLYSTFDDVDRENGIWRFLSQVKAHDVKTARDGLLKYKKDDREPFPDVYAMFAGKLSGDEMITRIDKASLSKDEREKRLFYAHLYVGLLDVVEDRRNTAIKHLRESTSNSWGRDAGYGPNYMWHVGRLHHDLLARTAKVDK
ncbi:MAG: tetratricopeptide repeat protein [Planctomycetales bacterium]|nr:tetratricopeptide repeat protein [Planctomycetales bacterium]